MKHHFKMDDCLVPIYSAEEEIKDESREEKSNGSGVKAGGAASSTRLLNECDSRPESSHSERMKNHVFTDCEKLLILFGEESLPRGGKQTLLRYRR